MCCFFFVVGQEAGCALAMCFPGHSLLITSTEMMGAGLGFRFQGLGLMVEGLGCRVQGLGLRVQGLRSTERRWGREGAREKIRKVKKN